MKLLLRFLKPHWKLCVLTVVLLFVDVAGSLFIPTLVGGMLNAGTSGAAFQSIVTTGIQMAVISAVAASVPLPGDMLRHLDCTSGQRYAASHLHQIP